VIKKLIFIILFFFTTTVLAGSDCEIDIAPFLTKINPNRHDLNLETALNKAIVSEVNKLDDEQKERVKKIFEESQFFNHPLLDSIGFFVFHDNQSLDHIALNDNLVDHALIWVVLRHEFDHVINYVSGKRKNKLQAEARAFRAQYKFIKENLAALKNIQMNLLPFHLQDQLQLILKKEIFNESDIENFLLAVHKSKVKGIIFLSDDDLTALMRFGFDLTLKVYIHEVENMSLKEYVQYKLRLYK
jgi:hypothetical protein